MKINFENFIAIQKLQFILSEEFWSVVLNKFEKNESNKTAVKEMIVKLNKIFKKTCDTQDSATYVDMLEELESIANNISSIDQFKYSMQTWKDYFVKEISPYLSIFHLTNRLEIDTVIIPNYLLCQGQITEWNKPPIETFTKESFNNKLKDLLICGITQILGGLLAHYYKEKCLL